MTTAPIRSTGQSALGSTTSASPGLGKDAFMKLLIAQLKNQDPQNPTDSKELVTQLSQLTSVEQMVSMNERLASVEAGLGSIASTQTSELVGKNVTAEVRNARLGADGPVTIPITLDAPAAKTVLTLRDAQGQVVARRELGPAQAGTRSYSWDGLGNDGTRLPAGNYSIDVRAEDTQQNSVGVSTRVQGVVSEVSYEGGVPSLIVGGARVRLGDVVTIAR